VVIFSSFFFSWPFNNVANIQIIYRRMIGECCMGKDLERHYSDVMEARSLSLPGGTEEFHEELCRDKITNATPTPPEHKSKSVTAVPLYRRVSVKVSEIANNDL
jgi:hypothetical protein